VCWRSPALFAHFLWVRTASEGRRLREILFRRGTESPSRTSVERANLAGAGLNIDQRVMYCFAYLDATQNFVGVVKSADRIGHLNKREAMEIGITSVNFPNSVLAHQHRRVGIVQNVTAQMGNLGNQVIQ